jgi:hypothetical protein
MYCEEITDMHAIISSSKSLCVVRRKRFRPQITKQRRGYVLVSSGFCDKIQQTRRLKPTEMYV